MIFIKHYNCRLYFYRCDKYDPYLLSIKSIDLVSSKKNLNYADLNDEGLSDLSVDLLTTFGVCAGLAIVFVLLGVLLLFISNRDAKNAPTEVED